MMKYLSPFRWVKPAPSSQDSENPVVSLQRALNSLFDDFFKGFDLSPLEEKAGLFSPSIDMTEDDKEIRITAELPGIDEKEIEVNLSRDVLTIKGQKTQEKEEKGRESYYMERSFGSFQRVIQLPAEVMADKVDANFKKGVLTIKLPKSAKEIKDQKKIQIKSS